MPGLTPARPVVLAIIFAAVVGQTAAEAQAPPDSPDVLVISEPVLAAFEKGLRTEIALREALRKELAALKTKAQFDKCSGEAMVSPEGAKVSESLLLIPDNITYGERLRRTERAGQRFLAFFQRKCGADPSEFGDTWRAARLQEIERKAADAAGPLPSP